MANIRLKELIEANVDPKLVARSKNTGKLVYFKSPEAKAAAVKSGSHEEPKKDKAVQAKQAKASADMFKGDYAKDRGVETPKDDTDWMDDLDSIDTSDINGKADPDADSFTHDDVFGATFKDPQTGKTITVGDAYDREDDSPAYQKAFAYVAKFDPDKEAVMGTQAYADLNKKDNVDISDYSTDGQSAVLYKGKKVGDYMYDDITDEFTLKTKDGIKAFDTQEDMYKYLQKNPPNEKPSLSSKLMSMFKK